MKTTRVQRYRWFARAALAATVGVARLAAASDDDQKRFELVPNPAFVRCLAAFPEDPAHPPTATVVVKPGRLNDQLAIQLRNFKPGLAFALFSLERSSLLSDGTPDPDFKAKGGFGLAWYQSDLEIKNDRRNVTNIRTVLVDEIFGLDSALGLAPTNTFHLGFWFDAPADAEPCGFAGPPTPFNGSHDAGPLAMQSVPDAETALGPLCLHPDLASDPVRCNP